ncbi:hypothetical protein HYFRA_00004116 [Hymenoscyphus fraxineus]|uniref:Orp1 like protein n=1 Tax=Hymenoscyphus fraxineus TaxID=746836 RepID=A0A9N9PNK7_9HELO|nr:hypothetical protein HYFRA_00004116 [Hymenoscyphus fraxineus]
MIHKFLQYLSAPPESHYQSLIHKSSHKRSASAPNIKAIMSDYRSEQAVSGHATPSSYHEHASTHSPQPQTAPGTPPMALEMGEAKDVVCMYIPNCDTGSQLRKAISHIFGRNKMCTRLIPQHVWVHYCRKHYQRSRYRNPKEYAKLQCDLVQQQIRRVHDWSMNNLKNDLPGTVQNWGLAVRKREQMRLDNISSGKRKRSASTAGFEDSDGEGDVPGNGHPVPPTAVPNWLLEKCGKGYNTHGILEIFNRLHTDILNDSLTCFPDIEILPNIIIDTAEEPKSPKGYAKRTVSGHKRSQSLGVAAKTDYSYSPGARRTSNPSIWGGVENPNQKRRRANEMENAPPLNAFGGPRSMRLAHRPVFHGIEEHQMNEGAYTHNHIPEQHVYQSPLPAPTPQRWGSQSMAHRLENEHAGVHRSHSRSRSDAGLMRGSPFPASYSPSMQHQYPGEQYRPSPYEQVAAQQAAHQHAQQQQQQAQQQQYGGYSRQGSQQPEMFGHHTPTMRHVRHQSSPMIHPQFQNGMRDPRMMNQYVQGHPNTLPPVSDGPQQPQLHPSHSYEGVPQMRNPFPGHR